MLVPNRHGSSNSYRYGFQGQEKDDELKGEGNSLNYTFRMHDPRVGRFFATDPLEAEFPWNSPYVFSENMVLQFVEVDGLHRGHPRYMRGTSKDVLRQRANRNRQRYGSSNAPLKETPNITRISTFELRPGTTNVRPGNRPSFRSRMAEIKKVSAENVKEFIAKYNLSPPRDGTPIGSVGHGNNPNLSYITKAFELILDVKDVVSTKRYSSSNQTYDSGAPVIVGSGGVNYYPKDGMQAFKLMLLENEYQVDFKKTMDKKLNSNEYKNSENKTMLYQSAYFSTLFELGDSPQTIFNKFMSKTVQEGEAVKTKTKDVVSPQIQQGY
jgi:RHS repeat-associated protein